MGSGWERDFSYTIDGVSSLAHKRKIDDGGYGDVHEMYDIRSGKCFARKLLHSSAPKNQPNVIENEARALRKLCNGAHQNIIYVFNLGHFRLSEYYFIDMELCDFSLQDYLHPVKEPKLSIIGSPPLIKDISSALKSFHIFNIMRQIASGVKFIHSHNEVHRDIKPSNILYSCKETVWKLADFGLTSQTTASAVLNTTSARGSPGYRAPELSRCQKFSQKVDIWSLGCVFYELATGEQAFVSDFAIAEYCFRNDPIRVTLESSYDETCKAYISDTIRRMLERDPLARPSASMLYEEFRGHCSENSTKVAQDETVENFASIGHAIGGNSLLVPEISVDIETMKEPVYTPLHSAERLWDRAYDNLKADNSTLVKAYEKVLTHELNKNASSSIASKSQENTIEQTNPATRLSQMSKLIQIGLKKTETETKAKQVIGSEIQVAASAKDLISSAIRTAPQAALAWTGVCIALQIFLNPTPETKTNRDGIIYIVSRMDWYWNLANLLLKENIFDRASFLRLRCEIENRIIGLYKMLLSYQMKSICSYYQNQGLVILHDIISLDDWNGNLKTLQDAEDAVRKDTYVYNTLQIRSHLEQLVNSARIQEMKLCQDAEREARDCQCLKDLYVTNPEDDLSRIETTKGNLLEESYIWILSHQDFINWRNKDEIPLLWIKGDPGKGKTMLLIGVVRELQKLRSAHNSILLSYFFCRGTDSRLNKATAVLRGLMYQLLIQQQSLISYLRERYDKEELPFEGINAFYALQDIFIKMLYDLRLTRVYLVVDALDECELELPQLLDFIRRNTSTSSSRVKWLVSSRNRPDIEMRLRVIDNSVMLSLELNANSVSRAVAAYIYHKVSELARKRGYDNKLQDQIRAQLYKKANETFLWVAFICEELRMVRKWNVLKWLEKVPSGLTEVYDRMIKQIQQSEDQSLCIKVLSICTLAYRPFHLHELAKLAGLPEEISCEQENLREIILMCGSFLTIREDVIYFIHQSAKDYVSSLLVDHLMFASGRTAIQCDIVSRSLQHMDEKLGRDIYNLQDPGMSIDQIISPHPDPLSQIRYCCMYWIDHLCEIGWANHYQVGLYDNGRIHVFLRKHFIHWLEALSLTRSVSTGVVMIRKLEDLLGKYPINAVSLLSMVRDANRFILYNRFIIENSPLQVYASALVFCPIMSKIKTLFQNERPQWIGKSLLVDESWSPCLQTLEGHTSSVNSVTFSHDGRWLASCSYDCVVRIWDSETGALQRTLEGHTSSVWSVAFSHDGRWAASSSDDCTVRVWDAEIGALQRTLEGHTSSVWSVAFAHDGRRLASCSHDHTVRVWDSETGALQRTLEGHTSSVRSVVFSPDARRLASCSDDCTVRIWDAETGALVQTLEGHTASVWAVAFSHDGRRLASCSHDPMVRVWDSEMGTLQQTLEGHTSSVRSVAFSPDGRRLASCSHDRTVRVWDSETGTLQQTLEGHTDQVWSVAFSHDGRRLASCSDDHTVRVWDPEMGALRQIQEGHTDRIRSVTFSHDGRRLASCSDDSTVRVWDTETGELQQTLGGHTSSVISAAFSHDGRRLASCSDDSTVRVWDAETGALQQTLEGHNSSVWSVAFSHDGRRLASCSDDCTVRVWDAETGALQRTLEGHTFSVSSVAFSHDGRRLASCSDDRTVRVWDTETGALQRMLEGYTSSVRSVGLSHDGRVLASCSNDGTVRIWHAETGRLQQTFEIGASLSTISFGSDDCNLITGLGCIALDQESNLPIATPNWSGYCLHPDRAWITCNGKKVLWLPPEYRPICSTVRQQTVAIGCASGRVVLIAGNT